MILHGFAWRSSKNTVLRPKTTKFDHQSKKYIRNFPPLGFTPNSTYHGRDAIKINIQARCGRWKPSRQPKNNKLEPKSTNRSINNPRVTLTRKTKGKPVLSMIFQLFLGLLIYVLGFYSYLKVFDLKIVFLGFLDAKPCRTIMKLPQKVSFGPEACEI